VALFGADLKINEFPMDCRSDQPGLAPSEELRDAIQNVSLSDGACPALVAGTPTGPTPSSESLEAAEG
jgi:hypothetical protein